jgi:hypothetical protein
MSIGPINAASVRSLLASYLNERWQGVYENGRGALIVPNMGRTACFVEPTDLPDGRTRVNVRAPILLEIPPSPALFELVALNATSWNFGALSMYEEDGLNLEFDYALLADGLSSSTLNYLVQVVGTTADDLAPKFQATYGGRFLV